MYVTEMLRFRTKCTDEVLKLQYSTNKRLGLSFWGFWLFDIFNRRLNAKESE